MNTYSKQQNRDHRTIMCYMLLPGLIPNLSIKIGFQLFFLSPAAVLLRIHRAMILLTLDHGCCLYSALRIFLERE